MNNNAFQTDIAVDHITKALNDFLRDKKLKLSAQQHTRLKKSLMVSLLDQEMSYSNAYSHLCDIMEYRKDYEISANAPDEAEEEMIRIIGAADSQEIENTKFKKPFITSAAILAMICAIFIGLGVAQYFENKKQESLELAQVIGSKEEEQLKTLVQKLSEVENLNGNDITPNAIYNDIKKLKEIEDAGAATSYKKFNQAQYQMAIDYLNKRLDQSISMTQPAAGQLESMSD